MNLERLRLGILTVWMFTALFLALNVRTSWTTSALTIAICLVAPIALIVMWDHPLPAFRRRVRDPRL